MALVNYSHAIFINANVTFVERSAEGTYWKDSAGWLLYLTHCMILSIFSNWMHFKNSMTLVKDTNDKLAAQN